VSYSTAAAVCPHCKLHRGHRTNCPTQTQATGDCSLEAYPTLFDLDAMEVSA